jgi:NADP-dependent aldehyde dehydrogenase
MFAEVLREGSWVDATIDQGDASRQPPKPDLRRMLVPLGPVAVFGASNFPLAFSVPGGDTASALAAGCPVVVKAHPAHPGTSELAADAIREAVKAVGLPSGVFSLLHGGIEVSRWLVMNEHAEAVAFTGSLAAGRSLYDLAASRARPIPVLAEMGSINPLLLMPKALEHRFDALVEGYVGSLTAGVGQFCTNPGLVLGAGSRFEMFIEAVGERLKSAQPGTMLTSRMRELYHEGCAERSSIQGLVTFGNGKHSRGQVMPAIFSVGLDKFMKHPLLLEELFGPAAVAVTCPSVEGMLEALSAVPGQLTATIHATDEELEAASGMIRALARKVGRIVFNGFPTGVEVGPAMQHGGPYPASTDSRFTSVGTAAIRRFIRPVCYQDVPQSALPEALRDGNPLGIWRTVDGKFGRA